MVNTVRIINITKALAAILVMTAASSCSENIFLGEGEGRDCVLSITYDQLLPKEIQVSRATASENALNNLQVFVFDAEENSSTFGKLKGYKYVGDASLLKQDGSIGSVDIKTTTGPAYIYAVANVPTSIYKVGNIGNKNSGITTIPTSETEAWNEDKAKKGDYEFTLGDLKGIPFQRESNEFNITEANYMMAGCANDGEACTIGENTSVSNNATITSPTGNDQIIQLRRIVSKVKFMVTAESGITFTPTRYQIMNIPRIGQLVRSSNQENNVEPADFESLTGSFTKQNEETVSGYTYNTFSVHLPENIHTNTSVTTWADREADENDSNGDKVFVNAPKGSTYVVVTGNYEGPLSTDKSVDGYNTKVQATVKYYVHLGDFGSDSRGYTDFSIERNCDYTFKVRIAGVNSIKVEAEKESDGFQPGAEGTVLSYATDNATVITLDSHYGKIDMTFKKNKLPSDGKFYVMVEDIRSNNSNNGFYTVTADNVTYRRDNQDVAVSGITNSDWLELVAGSDQEYSALFTNGVKNKALTIVNVLQEILKNKNTNSFWTNGSKTYTCFVNENYYEDKSWNEFVNKDPRILYIANKKEESSDGRSIYAEIYYGIKQNSIQTFYNTDLASSVNAYGCETDYDDNYEGHSSNTYSRQSIYWGDNDRGESTSTRSEKWDGRKHMLGSLESGNSTSLTTKLWSDLRKTDGYADRYRWARLVCMSRNRDNNGDGKIDEDEVRWYAPTMQQYLGLYIGKNALESEARLFNASTKDLNVSDYWTKRKAPALHYWSSTQDEPYIYWAEEGIATSSNAVGDGNNNDTAPCGIRCVRTLPKDKGSGTTVSPEEYYSYNSATREISLKNMVNSAIRTSSQNKELPPHTEEDVSNMASSQFVVAQNVSSTTTSEDVTTDDNTVCSNYSEDGKTWRAPNLMELALLNVVLGDVATSSSNYRACRTKFTNTDFRYSWVISETNIMMNHSSESNKPTDTVVVRCVRDSQ